MAVHGYRLVESRVQDQQGSKPVIDWTVDYHMSGLSVCCPVLDTQPAAYCGLAEPGSMSLPGS